MDIPRERMLQIDPTNLERAVKAVMGINMYLKQSNLEEVLLQLVDLRVSQINGCAFCIDMHTKDLRALGETEQRIYLLSAWRESSSFYTEREQAALAWAEAVTLVAESRVPDEVYQEVRPHFSDDELFALTVAVSSINVYNRMNVALRTVPGTYQVPARHGTAQSAAAD